MYNIVYFYESLDLLKYLHVECYTLLSSDIMIGWLLNVVAVYTGGISYYMSARDVD